LSYLRAYFVLILSLLSVNAYCDEVTLDVGSNYYRLIRDANVSISSLIKSKEIKVVSTRKGYNMFVDSSAVFEVQAEAFAKAVISYNRYVAWKVPTLNGVRILSQSNTHYLVWNWLSILGVKSKHCIYSQRFRAKAETIRLAWKLVKCPKVSSEVLAKLAKKKLKKEYTDEPAFRDLHGSFYIETLNPKLYEGKRLIYVRYYTATKLNTSIPPSLVQLISKFRLKSDIRKMLKVFNKHAK